MIKQGARVAWAEKGQFVLGHVTGMSSDLKGRHLLLVRDDNDMYWTVDDWKLMEVVE